MIVRPCRFCLLLSKFYDYSAIFINVYQNFEERNSKQSKKRQVCIQFTLSLRFEMMSQLNATAFYVIMLSISI